MYQLHLRIVRIISRCFIFNDFSIVTNKNKKQGQMDKNSIVNLKWKVCSLLVILCFIFATQLLQAAPSLNCDNLNVTINCQDARGENDLPIPSVTSDCGSIDQLILTFTDDESGLDDCGHTGFITRTWMATDACLETATCEQIITIIDTSVPNGNFGRRGTVINCNGVTDVKQSLIEENLTLIEFYTNFSTDNCSEITVTSDFDASIISNNCQAQPETTVTFTISDECGNAITNFWNYTIIDRKVENPLCDNLQIESSNNQLSLSNIIAPNSIVKVFDPNYQIISTCSGDCPETVSVPNLIAGETYYTDIQLYDENWDFICEDKQAIEIIGDSEPCDTSICQGDVVLQTQAEVDAFCGCEVIEGSLFIVNGDDTCLLYTSPSPRDATLSRMPSSA